MNTPESAKPDLDPQAWDKRKSANIRLGLYVGLVVVLMFLGAIWKYRPL